MNKSYTKTRVTYSAINKFINCRQAYKFRYIDELVPIEKNDNLIFGSIIHNCLEIWYENYSLEKVFDYINQTVLNKNSDKKQKEQWHLANAIMTSYIELYPNESFKIIDLEKQFEGKIINPKTNYSSRKFIFSGKVDGIVEQNGKYFLLEHKTTSMINENYLEKLWMDLQIRLYSIYLKQCFDIEVEGVIYNIIVKAKLKQNKGETEEEYLERFRKLIEVSKNGKSTAKRKMPEDDISFQSRLLQKYKEPGMFQRELIYFSADQLESLQYELWDICKSINHAEKNNLFYKNTSNCFKFGSLCPYLMICSSKNNNIVIENHYEKKVRHEKLKEK